MSAENDASLQKIEALCLQNEHSNPRWVARMRENPAVWSPHRPYGKYSSDVPARKQVGCCEFPIDHPIHGGRSQEKEK